MVLGTVLQATAFSRPHIIVGRVVTGCGVGITNPAIAVFQSEFSPKGSRGLCAYKP